MATSSKTTKASQEKDYSAVPLIQKLGIVTRSKVQPELVKVFILNEPKDFQKTLGSLPINVQLLTKKEKVIDVILYFETDKNTLLKKITTLAPLLSEKGGLWIVWPKKTSGVVTDVTFEVVQPAGLALGLVDNKVCAIDATWTALRFVHRRK